MRQVTSEQTRYKLLQIPQRRRDTPLHRVASRGATQAIQIICDYVSSHHLIHLLNTKNGLWGHTPVQTAAWLGNQEAVINLQDYYSKALIDIALQQTDLTGIAMMADNNKDKNKIMGFSNNGQMCSS